MSSETVFTYAAVPDDNLPVHLLMAGITSPGYSKRTFRLREESFFVFQYIKSGCGYVMIDGTPVKAQAGDVIINHVGTDHGYWSDPNDPWSKIWLNVSGTLVTELLRIYQLEQINIIPQVPEMEEVFTNCIASLTDSAEDIAEESAVALHRIICRLVTAAGCE